MSLKPMAVHYSMLCNPRKDGDGRTLATELRKPLDKLLTAFAIQSKMQWEEFVRITSSRYLSDGDDFLCPYYGDRKLAFCSKDCLEKQVDFVLKKLKEAREKTHQKEQNT